MLAFGVLQNVSGSKRGSRGNESRNFLSVLRQQRESRNLTAKQNNAALCVQRVWRRWVALRAEKLKRVKLHECISDLTFLRHFFFIAISSNTYRYYISTMYGDCSCLGLCALHVKLQSVFFTSYATSHSDTIANHAIDRDRPNQTPSEALLYRRLRLMLEHANATRREVLCGRQFFLTSSAPLSSIVQTPAQNKFAVVDVSCTIAANNYKQVFLWCTPRQILLFQSFVVPKAYQLLMGNRLPVALGYRVLFLFLTHSPRFLKHWGILHHHDWDDSLCIRFSLRLFQESPSVVSRLFVLFDVIPQYLRDNCITSNDIISILCCLNNPSCVWQRRLVVGLIHTAVQYNTALYKEIQSNVGAYIVSLFTENDEGLTQLFIERLCNVLYSSKPSAMELDANQRNVTPEVQASSATSPDILQNTLDYFNIPFRCDWNKSCVYDYMLVKKQNRDDKRCLSMGTYILSHEPSSIAGALSSALRSPGPLAMLQFLYAFQSPHKADVRLVQEFGSLFTRMVETMGVPSAGDLVLVKEVLKVCLDIRNHADVIESSTKEGMRRMTSDTALDNLNKSRFLRDVEAMPEPALLSAILNNPTLSSPLWALCHIFFPLQCKGNATQFLQSEQLPESFDCHLPETQMSSDTDEGIADPNEEPECQSSEQSLLSTYLKEACSKDDSMYSFRVMNGLSARPGLFKGILALFHHEVLKVWDSNKEFLTFEKEDLHLLFTKEIIHLCVVLATLLAAGQRPGSFLHTFSTETLPLQLKICDFTTSLLGVNTLVFMLNRLTSFLLQAFKRTPHNLRGTDDLRSGALLLSHSLRDIHRLRYDLLPADAWITKTHLLKATEELMEQAERFRSWQYNFISGEPSSLFCKGRPCDITVQGTRESVYALSMLVTRLPHAISFKDRSLILTLLLIDEKLTTLGLLCDNSFFIRHDTQFRIRRSHIVMDTVTAMHQERLSWRHPIAITFIDYFGNPEKGVDGGGLFREYITLLSRALFSPSFGLFESLSDRSLIPCCTAYATHGDLTDTLFRLTGILLGKAIFERIVLEPVLNRIFLNKIRNIESHHLEDLKFLDPELYRQLRNLDRQEDIESLQLTFSATVLRGEKHIEEIDLMPEGRRILVCRDNVEVYKRVLTNFHLDQRFANEAEILRDGLTTVIPLEWLRFFEGAECSCLISGEQQSLDVNDLASHVDFSGGFTSCSPTILNLWTLLKNMSTTIQRQFLMFVTGCSRPPFLGFRMLQPRFKIQQVDNTDLLPTASTCVNQLNLPAYESLAILREKLYAALEMAQGFELY